MAAFPFHTWKPGDQLLPGYFRGIGWDHSAGDSEGIPFPLPEFEYGRLVPSPLLYLKGTSPT